MKLKQAPCWPCPFGVAQGQSHEYGGKGLSGEKVLEKSLIIELGWAQPVSFFSCPDRLLPLRDVAEGRASQLLWRLKPRSAWGPRLLRPPLCRVHMPQSDEAHAQTHWAHLTQPLYKKPRAGRVDSQAGSPKVDCPAPIGLPAQPRALPSLSLLTVDCYFGLWGTKGS